MSTATLKRSTLCTLSGWNRLLVKKNAKKGQVSVATVGATWHRAARHSGGGRPWSRFGEAATAVSSRISGRRIFICQTAQRSCALYSSIRAWIRASGPESSLLLQLQLSPLLLGCFFTKLVVSYKSNLFTFSILRIEVCLVSTRFLLATE